MKRFIRLIVVSAIFLALVALCACSHEARLVGTWQGDGTLDVSATEAPYEFATEMVFSSDGTVVITVDGYETQYGYHATDDTLTLNGGDMSYGILYSLSHRTLTIYTGGNKVLRFSQNSISIAGHRRNDRTVQLTGHIIGGAFNSFPTATGIGMANNADFIRGQLLLGGIGVFCTDRGSLLVHGSVVCRRIRTAGEQTDHHAARKKQAQQFFCFHFSFLHFVFVGDRWLLLHQRGSNACLARLRL